MPEHFISLVMALYSKRFRTLACISDEFGIEDGVHQLGSALSPLLFMVVMQEATRAARGEGLWDLLYNDD